MKRIIHFLFFLSVGFSTYSQYADLGVGSLKDKIWWFNWNGFSIADGASKTFTTADGLQVTITFSRVEQRIPIASVMTTWPGSVLHYLYDFADPAIKPALFSEGTTIDSKFSMSITATRDGVPSAFHFVAVDAEGSDFREKTNFTTNGSNWTIIDFFRNSGQTTNPVTGCNSQSIMINETYGGVFSAAEPKGQNPVMSTKSPASEPLNIDVFLEKNGVYGGMAVAFGIFAPIDRGDLPATYGFAQHQLWYNSSNSCSYMSPFPTIVQDEALKIGSIAGDADGTQTIHDGPDEDGFTNFTAFDQSGIYTIRLPLTNKTGSDAYLAGWFDYDQSGTFSANEYATVSVPHNATEAILQWTGLPATMAINGSFAFRFRLSSDMAAAQSIDGYAKDGEVEDYLIPAYLFQAIDVSFSAPDKVCINAPVNITNTSTGASSYYWSFCTADINQPPTGQNFSISQSTRPVYIDYVYENGKYYGFETSNHPSGLLRLDFGNSLLNTPVVTNLGTINGLLGDGTEGIQVVKNNNKWYLLIVGGLSPYLVTVNLGTDITNNSPTGTNWGNIGNMAYPHDLFVFQDNGTWYGLTPNTDNNTITLINFTASLDNAPNATNLGNIGNLDKPTGLHALKDDNNNWHVFVTNSFSSTLTRLDFGNSLLNTPTGINLGNIGGAFKTCWDIYVIKYCGTSLAYVINAENGNVGDGELIKLDFNGDITNTPIASNFGNIGQLSFPHCLSKLFRVGADVYSFITDVTTNSITRLQFAGCTNASIPNYSGQNPPPVVYSTAGTYNINLTVDDGLPTQTSFCKQIVVLQSPKAEFTFSQDVCNPKMVQFKNESVNYTTINWDFSSNIPSSANETPSTTFNDYGLYTIKLKATNQNGCADSIIKQIPIQVIKDNTITTKDTSVCNNESFQLNSIPALKYCWSPTTGLSDAYIANPVINNFIPKTTYYLNALVQGPNLIKNGDFSQGNTGFTSDYQYAPVSGFNPNTYTVSSNILSWHSGMLGCRDKTTGTGNMMLVNGSEILDAKVWVQTVAVQPNTNYAFSTWLQHITIRNPAQLQFSINGIQLGNIFNANTQSCLWEQFYTVWNSGNNTTATISIVNKNQGADGNDFSLDDISFSELKLVRDSVTIAINPKPEVNFNSTIPYCKSVQLEGTINSHPYPIQHWNWRFGDNTTADARTLTHAYSKGGTYNIKLLATDINGCKDSTTKTIQLDTATATIAYSGPVCPGETVTLQGAGGTQYEWSPAALISNPSSQQTTANLTNNTRFYLKVTDALGCEDTASIVAKIVAKPLFIKPTDIQTCKGNSVVLNANANPSYQYIWSPADYLNDPSTASPVATPEVSTQYTLHITEPVCDYDTSFIVKALVSASANIFVLPNAFTPNDDGKNDCFGVKNWGNTTIHEFNIYNRWGQKLFATKDPSHCWDGKYKGQLQAPGAYVYIIKALTPCGEVERKGSFMLIR